ncbi:GGDEF domain-containing protein [Edaphobacter flagellatus]|uniref:GGDEF domain-containing protein n=1 Tax=Edaphobacter flagellatus TaxID=1933044 RepID=UPI0021B2B254|nr:GGDEF domain-containing protein [Edaphobacter flagellatus]
MDIHTAHIEHVVLLALYTLLAIANSWLYRGMKGVNGFCLYSLFTLLGAAAVALRGQMPDPISIISGTVFVSVGYAFLFLGLKDFFNLKTTQAYFQGLVMLLMAAAMVQYGWIEPDTSKRLIFYSFFLCLQQIHITVLLFRNHDPALLIPTRSMALMVIALALSNCIRIVGVSVHGAPHNYLDAGPFLAWILIANSALQAGIMISYVWLTAAMLRGKLEVQATTDPLTGVLNRRGIEIAAEQRILACLKDGSPLCAIVIDLDDFKSINDSYGHHCGDATLIAVASCLQRGIRPTDRLARIGGDEFALLLPNTPHDEAIAIAERLRSSIASTDVTYGEIHTRVSASFGLAQLQPNDTTWEQLFLCCDKLLYEEKRSIPAAPSRKDVRGSELGLMPY